MKKITTKFLVNYLWKLSKEEKFYFTSYASAMIDAYIEQEKWKNK